MTAVTGNTGYHIVVVGGAAAGCVIAARLSEDGSQLNQAKTDIRSDLVRSSHLAVSCGNWCWWRGLATG
jgi:glycine/D-amino acid oxidase-like deaminating enzyme